MSYPVQLYIYDLSQGMARSLGPALGLHDLEGEFDMILVRTIFGKSILVGITKSTAVFDV